VQTGLKVKLVKAGWSKQAKQQIPERRPKLGKSCRSGYRGTFGKRKEG